VVNIIILILYRTGYKGEFLGVGGTWNLNEDKNPDAEIVASGVLVGFFIYTSVVLISYCFGTTYHKRTLVEIIMNFVGTFMFVAVGGTALHYWHGYQAENKFDTVVQERQYAIEGEIYKAEDFCPHCGLGCRIVVRYRGRSVSRRSNTKFPAFREKSG
ncbi:hypothetical protein E2986_09803, partial [Frieseomelitta varia]